MKPAGLELRPAMVSDAAVIADLGRRTFIEAFGTRYSPEDLSSFLDQAYSESIQRQELFNPDFHYVLAILNGRPIGFSLLRSGTSESCITGLLAIELQRLYALKETHGTGVGSALMERCIKDAENLGRHSLWLGVWEHNDQARSFYAKWGFSQVGSHTFSVGSQADVDLVLERGIRRRSIQPRRTQERGVR